jgi:enamine deaminase RidA (YjgF/YER057c/UK114 family)
MQKRDINSELAPQPASAYSQAVEVSGGIRILFISGQVGTEADGTTRPPWRNRPALRGVISGRN